MADMHSKFSECFSAPGNQSTRFGGREGGPEPEPTAGWQAKSGNHRQQRRRGCAGTPARTLGTASDPAAPFHAQTFGQPASGCLERWIQWTLLGSWRVSFQVSGVGNRLKGLKSGVWEGDKGPEWSAPGLW
eukprot:2452147-Rhodomonas_salina.2